MGVEVVLFTYLAELAGGQRRVCCSGSTVREVLRDLAGRHPGLAASLWDEAGGLNGALVVHLAGRALSHPVDLDEAVAAGDEVMLLPLVTGG